MPDATQCPECGAELPSGQPKGLCPRCALKGALDLGAEEGSGSEVCVSGLPRAFGDYELLEEIARGGMGIVYKARQKGLGRMVAVKMLLSGQHASTDLIRRFKVEAVAAGSLQHANIVAIHEVGFRDGQHFIAMDYVNGPNLAQFVRSAPLLPRRAAQYLKTIAEAIHYAHERRVLHRDLKPSNVLIDENDRPRVTDFGLAKGLGASPFGAAKEDEHATVALYDSITDDGHVLGSPSYMPPEQAAGKRGALGRCSDVYSLGAMLYHMLTGHAPFGGGSLADTLQQVQHQEPVPPRFLNAGVPRDLQTICLKCLEKKPEDRYPTAKELADELARFLGNEPIRVRPVGGPERLWRWCRRKPALASSVAGTIVALGIAAVLAAQVRRISELRSSERKQSVLEKALLTVWSGDADASEAAISEAELAGASSGQTRMLRGQMAFHHGEYQQAVQHLEQAVRLLPKSVAARSMLAVAWNRLGNWNQAEAMLQSLYQMPSNSSEDSLFKAMAESEVDPARGLATLEEGVRSRPTALARLIRARVRFLYATWTGNLSDAEGAVIDANIAQQMLPGNLVATTTSLYAHLAVAGAYDKTGQKEKRDAVLRQAGQDAAALRRFPKNQHGIVARTLYLKYAGEDQTAVGELREAAAEVQNLLVDYLYASVLYRRGQFDDALKAMARTSAGRQEAAYLYILAEASNGPERALMEFRRAWREGFLPTDFSNLQAVLRLLGRNAEAVEACRALGDKAAALGPWRNGWDHRLLGYHCGQLTAEELLKSAGLSNWNQCEAHFHIGMTRLGDGNRRGAREHFTAAVATRAFHQFEYDWSGAFLARMERDPTWPPWIPLKPEATARLKSGP